MEGRVKVLAALLVGAMTGAAAQDGDCPPGEKIHWIADYCMARIGTDDEIVAMDCIDEEDKKARADDCAAKRHYKRELCRWAISYGHSGSLEACVADPQFMGRTVRNGGVGG